MKPVVQAVLSVLVSTAVSILATRLLRHLLFLTERPGSESGGEQHAPIIVVMPIAIGNTFGPTIVPRNGKVPPFLAKASKHR